eukprot:m.483417 g.483417  ORF g.483417 m.483417 type:complete len:73 (+) comp22932_c0_seq1:181-399(+)
MAGMSVIECDGWLVWCPVANTALFQNATQARSKEEKNLAHTPTQAQIEKSAADLVMFAATPFHVTCTREGGQ